MKAKLVLVVQLIALATFCSCSEDETPNDPLTISLKVNHASGINNSDGSIDLTISGGDGNHFIEWSNGANTEDISDLPIGKYIVEVGNASSHSIATDSVYVLYRLTSNDGDSYPSWSPNGEMIAYKSYTRNGICMVSISGGTSELIIPGGSDPAWSPDGKTIAFSKDDEIWLFDTESQIETKITNGDIGGTRPSWSPDGSQIVCEFEGDIWIHNTDGSNSIDLVSNQIHEGSPSWSPDGTAIAYTSSQNEISELWTIPPTGGTPKQITNLGKLVLYPSWSPDSKYLVYSNLVNRSSDLYNIYIISASGGNQIEVVNNSSYDSYPAFSPNGKHVIFSSFGNSKKGIWVVGLN